MVFVHLSKNWHVIYTKGLITVEYLQYNGSETVIETQVNLGSIVFGIWEANSPGASVITAHGTRVQIASCHCHDIAIEINGTQVAHFSLNFSSVVRNFQTSVQKITPTIGFLTL